MPVWSLELLHFATRREASLRTKTNPRRIERPRNSRETEPEPWSDHTWSLYNHWTSPVKWHISCLNWVFCYLQPKWASGFSINLFCAMIGNKAASQQNGFKMLPNINSCIIQILIYLGFPKETFINFCAPTQSILSSGRLDGIVWEDCFNVLVSPSTSFSNS